VTKKTKKSESKPSELDNKFQLLLTLITLLKSARHKVKKTELEFLMVNQTFNLIPYRNCAYWEYNKKKATIKNVSGLVQIDPDGPYTQWLVRVIETVIKNKAIEEKSEEDTEKEKHSYTNLSVISPNDCAPQEAEDWKKWVTENAYFMIMRDQYDQIIGGLWLDRKDDLSGLEKAILEDLGDGYAFALQGLEQKKQSKLSSGFGNLFNFSGLKTKLFFLALIIIMLIPVRMSATAPAEVVPNKPFTINIPFDGVIDTVEVTPGQMVRAGDVLLRMDSTLLKNRVTLTSGELRAAKLAITNTERESMKDRTKLAEIAILKAQMAQKTAEAEFAREMLNRADIVAQQDGVVIFSDPNALRGKPVQTGEQVMQLANLDDSELLIRMPVNSMIKIDEDIPAKFFLNVMPLNSQKLSYKSIGYQATMDGGSIMTYKIRGKFIDKNEELRIGWTGTGKVYGERTILAVNILRRPITTLRRKLGL